VTISPAQVYEIEYEVTQGNTKVTKREAIRFVSKSVNMSYYETKEYIDKDGKRQKQDVLARSTSDITTCRAAVNATEWKSRREGGSGFDPGATVVRETRVSKSYKITEDGPVERRQVQKNTSRSSLLLADYLLKTIAVLVLGQQIS
jgi:hypothetical protein